MRRAGGILAIFLLLAGAFAAGLVLAGPATHGADDAADAPAPLRPVDEVRRELAARYYRHVPRAALRKGTVTEMLEALGDPYTEYLNAAEYDGLKSRTAPSYSGVGLTVVPSERGLVVRAALQGPAREAGIARGDVIVAINGHSVTKLPFEQSLMLIKGVAGTKVELTLRRPSAGNMNVTVVREQIAVPVIRPRLLTARGRKVGYVHVLSFPVRTADGVARAIRSLVKQGAGGVVLDLRENPGGLVSEAVRTVSLFQRDGVVCTTAGLHQRQRVYEVSGNALYPRLPLVVLVNRASASAAEIVAGALRDNSRALVVGERTYGKAFVQTVRELSNGEALKLTTAVFLTPAGTSLSGGGLRPAITAADDVRTRRDEALARAERALLAQIPE